MNSLYNVIAIIDLFIILTACENANNVITTIASIV